MKIARAITALAFLSSGTAFAQQATAPASESADTAAPSTAAPTQLPPTIPANPGQPPGATASAAPAPQAVATAPAASAVAPAAAGQWSYTTQYGWVYLPYSQNYTYVNPDGSVAYEYAYYPARGWAWIEAPWVLGWGPRPYWGHYGYAHFAWYAHPWFHAGVYYRGAYGYHTHWGHPARAVGAYRGGGHHDRR